MGGPRVPEPGSPPPVISSVTEVLDELRQTQVTPTLSAEVRKTLANVIAYLEIHRDHIDDEGYKEMGFPIGSEMVESGCKWLIQQRFKCVGMRWSEDGFNHLLHLRLAWVNGTFDELFKHPQSTNLADMPKITLLLSSGFLFHQKVLFR
jgi:hypothetical protein